MYSILLVDDEKMELEALSDYIHWEDMGIRVAGTAKNGREALLKTEQLKPDIILTDVRMPIMDGLEFTRRARQLDPNVKIVFLSGHDEFHYIKAAFSVEAAGYLLKPIDLDELRHMMDKVKKKCEESKVSEQMTDVLKEKWLRKLLAEEDRGVRMDLAKRISGLPASLPMRAIYTAAYITVDRFPGTAKNGESPESASSLRRQAYQWIDRLLQIECPGSCMIEWQEEACIVIFYRTSESLPFEWQTWSQQLLHRISAELPVTLTIGLSQEGRALEDIPDLFAAAKTANENKFYIGKGHVITPEHVYETVMEEVELEPAIHRLRHALSHLRAEDAEAVVTGLFASFRNRKIHRDLICSAALHVVTSVEQHFSALRKESGFSTLLAGDWKTISDLETMEEIEDYVRDVCRTILARMEEKDRDRNLNVVRKMIEIIDQSFHKPLTVEQISKEVFLSPNYIRSLFKEKTGETVLEYLTRKRILHAEELLHDKSLKIHEIAAASGYENVSYFCSVFQKYKGITPNEYRKKLL